MEQRKEWLTKEIAEEYRKKAMQNSVSDTQDIGERRTLRLELQKRCEITELEAINILNGRNIADYINKYYMIQNHIPIQKDRTKNKNLIDLQVMEELEHLKSLLKDDFLILDEK